MEQILKRVLGPFPSSLGENMLKKFSESSSPIPTYILDEDSVSNASTVDDDYETDDGFESSRSSSSTNDSSLANDWKNNRERIDCLQQVSKQHDRGMIQLAHSITTQENEHRQYDEAIFTLAKDAVETENCAKVQQAKIQEMDARLELVERVCSRINQGSTNSGSSARGNSSSDAAPPTYTLSEGGLYICDKCCKAYKSKQYFPNHKCLPTRGN